MRLTLERDAAVLHHDDPVGERDDLVEPVRDVHDRVPTFPQLPGDPMQLRDLLDREGDARLVEEEDASVVVERARDHHEALLDCRQAGHRSRRVDAGLELLEHCSRRAR